MSTAERSSSNNNDRLLFASCTSQHHPQVLWENMLDRNASAFTWGGDAIYADSYVKQATPKILKELYDQQQAHAGYQALVQSGVPIWGVLDDHDYGTNNGDQTYPYRTESAALFACDFLQLGRTICENRAKKGLGIYGVKVMDFSRPKGEQVLTEEEAGLDIPDVVGENNNRKTTTLGDKSVAIFLLDVRSNKTPYTKKMGSEDGDFLGEAQWTWLEETLARSTAAVNILVVGVQVHADRLGPVESWARFPKAQQRLYQALLQPNVQAPILVSGDVHHAQLLRKDCMLGDSNAPTKQTLLEVTTSGMTHSWGSRELCGRPHQLFLCEVWWFQVVASKVFELAQWFNGWLVWTEVIHLAPSEVTEEGTPGLQYALEKNFAELEFDWHERAVTVRILGQHMGAKPLLSKQFSLAQLSPRPWQQVEEGQEWTCVNYRGIANPVLRVVGVAVPVAIGWTVFLSPALVVVYLLLGLFKKRRPLKSKQS